MRQYGTILQKCSEPRSYLIETVSGTYRRNRWHLIDAPYHISSKTQFNYTPITQVAQPSLEQTGVKEVSNEEDVNRQSVDNSCNKNNEHKEDCTLDVDRNNVSHRPTRQCNKPGWLKDYVT